VNCRIAPKGVSRPKSPPADRWAIDGEERGADAWKVL
jgi:hypothetical protein